MMQPNELLCPNDGREGAHGPVKWRVAARVIDSAYHHRLAWRDAIDARPLAELGDPTVGAVAHYGQWIAIELGVLRANAR